MSENASTASDGVRVKFAFHPTFHVPSLEMSEEFFERVFGRPSTLLEVMPKGEEPDQPDKPRGYSKMTMISDVLIDCVCPDLHRINGVQASPSVDVPVLQNIGWYSDDIDDTFRALRRAKVPLVTQIGVPVEGDEPPTPDQGGSDGPIKMYFTPPAEMGLRYQFLTYFPMPIDPRSKPEWSVPEVSDADPLGIAHLSHHVILTQHPQRSIQLLVDALGGTVIHEGRDELLGVSGPYVHLADGIYHFATPDAGSPGATALAAKLPGDKYYSMTWKVVDLDRVANHLEKTGVQIQSRTDDTIIAEPATCFQLPWGFTTRSVPGDPRA